MQLPAARRLTRREMLSVTGVAATMACTRGGLVAAPQAVTVDGAVHRARLRAASLEFAITPQPGGATSSRTGAVAQRVAGPLKTTVTLLEDGALRLCLVTTHFNSPKAANVSRVMRRAIAEDLGLPLANVLLFVSHNHSDQEVASNQVAAHEGSPDEAPEPKLLPLGEELLRELRSHAKRLPGSLQPVTVWWAEGSEGRITYNRKGRRADGSTYFIREEDRDLLGKDYHGDIDRHAPIVVLKNPRGNPVAALVQFTGHPVTCYHPEKPVVFGDWPQVACDVVAEHLSPGGTLPVGFLQGCCGDVNSKGMFRGSVDLSTRYGRMLGQSYIEAANHLRPSQRDGLSYAAEKVRIPLAPLPSEETLRAEVSEMRDFIRRAAAGDPDTLNCVGPEFSPRAHARLPWQAHRGGFAMELLGTRSAPRGTSRHGGQAPGNGALRHPIGRRRHRGHAVRAVSRDRAADPAPLATSAGDPLRLCKRFLRLHHRQRQHGRSRVCQRLLPLHQVPRAVQETRR